MKPLFKPVVTLLLLFCFGGMNPIQAQIQLGEERIVISNESNVNSPNREFSPAFYKDGIVFISTKYESLRYKITDTRIGENIMSIYRAGRDMQGILRTPEIFAPELLSSYHEGPVTFDRTGEQLFFTRNDTNTPNSRKYTRKLRIYSAVQVENLWVNIQETAFNTAESNNAHPSLSVEGDMMFFASDREGGFGGMDLYMMTKDENNDWTEPVNLGPNINTAQNEVFPFIHADGTLYFSSNGHNGAGNLDLYYSNQNGSTWEVPVNLGRPFNTDQDDFGIIIDRDNRNGYFSSNRPGGLGSDDIYGFNIIGDQVAGIGKGRKGKKKVVVNVTDEETGQVLKDVEIDYLNLDNVVLSDDNNGQAGVIELKSEDGVLKLDANQKGNNSEFNDKGQHTVTLEDGRYILNIKREGYAPVQYAIVADQVGDKINIQLRKAVDCLALTGKVLDDKYIKPVTGASVRIQNMDTGEVADVMTDGSGNFNYCLKCNQTYTFTASKHGVTSETGILSTKGTPCTKNAKLGISLYLPGTGATAPLALGTVIQLPNIYYNFDDASLRPDALQDLNVVAELLNRYPDVEIELGSHTDARGSNGYNQRLSQKRTDNALNYLINRGIAANRLTGRGYGEADIKNRCVNGVNCDENEHQKNRRTEIIVTKVSPALANAQITTNVSPPNRASNIGQSVPISTKGGNQYLVIAGTFRNSDNAQDRASEVRKFGFSNVEVVQLTNSAYHIVVVERYYDQRTAANELVRTLKRDYQMKSYIKTLQ